MRIRSWRELTDLADSWDDQDFSRFIRAEEELALNRADRTGAVAMYRTANYFPGLLQTKNYVEAQCRGIGMSRAWTQATIALRMARQRLLEVVGIPQRFLVDEAALTYRPGGYSEVVAPQLDYALGVLKNDLKGYKTLDFRIVPTASLTTLPGNVYRDTFSLLRLGGEQKAFTEPWCQNRIEAATPAQTALLAYSWEQIGNVALNPVDSIDCMQAALRAL